MRAFCPAEPSASRELFARAVHLASGRHAQPFIKAQAAQSLGLTLGQVGYRLRKAGLRQTRGQSLWRKARARDL